MSTEKPRAKVGRWCWSDDGGESYGDTFSTRELAIADAQRLLYNVYQDAEPRSIMLAQVGEVVDAANAISQAVNAEDLIESAEDFIYDNYGNEDHDVIQATQEDVIALELTLRSAVDAWAASRDVHANYYVVDPDTVEEVTIYPDLSPVIDGELSQLGLGLARLEKLLKGHRDGKVPGAFQAMVDAHAALCSADKEGR